MIKSMTGFGNAELQGDKFLIKIEIKSLNGKYLELNLRNPKSLSSKELWIRKHFGAKLKRGSILFSIYLEKNPELVQSQALNPHLAKKYYKQIKELADDLKTNDKDILRTILLMPDVFKTEDITLEEKEWNDIVRCCETAYEQFDEFRKKEGIGIAAHLKESAQKIGYELLPKIEGFESDRTKRLKNRLTEKLNEWADSKSFDENRFEQEMIYYMEKYDISEEKNRLKAHCDLLIEELSANASGKKMGFIGQEMGREINTLGSKANHAEMQKVVIEMKDELEKIKEQGLNVL